LEDLERRVIQQAQSELAPSPAIRERHEAALLARIARDLPLGSDVSGLRALGRPAAGTPWFGFSGLPGRMLGVGLAVGVLVGSWVGYSLGQRRADLDARRAASAAPLPADVAPAAPPPEPIAAPPAASAEPGSVPSESPVTSPTQVAASAIAEPIPAGSGRPPKRAVRAAPRAAESSLAEELAMLQRARRALGAGNGLLALGIVSELDERFPKGVLIEERIATRVFSLCALDRVPEARAVGREFLARYASSVYAERVRTSCIEAPE
jgi:hypothetical protein